MRWDSQGNSVAENAQRVLQFKRHSNAWNCVEPRRGKRKQVANWTTSSLVHTHSHPVGAGQIGDPAGAHAEEERGLCLGALRAASARRTGRQPTTGHCVHQSSTQVGEQNTKDLPQSVSQFTGPTLETFLSASLTATTTTSTWTICPVQSPIFTTNVVSASGRRIRRRRRRRRWWLIVERW